MQQADPLPWGALDNYQAHFIVRHDPGKNPAIFLTKTELTTSGHFGSKQLLSIRWSGTNKLASILNKDTELSNMILQQSIDAAKIYIEPTDDVIRIHGTWNNHLSFKISRDVFEIYDRIASHIKSI